MWGLFNTPNADSSRLLSAERFTDLLRLERMRTDRGGMQFALLAFDVGENKLALERRKALTQRLTNRLRAIDQIGVLPDGRIAAFLPDTSATGARILANELARSNSNDDTPKLELFLYPLTGDPAETKDVMQLACAEASAPTTALEPLLVLPTPVWKRAMDLFLATFGLLVLSPVFLVAACLVKLTSPGPVLFQQGRTGWGGRVFKIYKFRTMCTDAEDLKAGLREQSERDGPAFKIKRDPRVTWVGRYLRRSCIDELPQFWNVLRGDMSIVGPRPLPVDESDRCEGWQRERLTVPPGLTCTWQVSGGIDVSFLEWMRMDLRYIRQRNPWRELKLLWRTFVAVVLHRASH